MSETSSDENVASSPPEEEGGRFSSILSSRAPLILAVSALVASLALVCLLLYFLIRNESADQPTPTPSTAIEFEVNPDEYVYVAASESGTISVTMETPIFLNIAGDEFSVQPEIVPAEGGWTPIPPNETTALWVYGSIINYVFGLDDTQENRALLENLNPGDEIVLTTRSGLSSAFAVSRRQEVNSDNRAIFAQRAPGITLVVIEEDLNAQRLVVSGRFVVSDSKENEDAGRVVEMGETAQLEGLQITVNSVGIQLDRPEAAPGFAFYNIDYQIQNVGTESVNANLLNMVLVDDLGNLYALNPIASQVGNYPMLSGSVEVGETVLATAGYQIPAGITSRTLRWQVTKVDTGSQIQVNIPFQDAGGGAQDVVAQVQEAGISPDGSNLIIVGQLTNLGQQPLVVDIGNVSLDSSGTVFRMLSTNPAFPWTVGPGQTLVYQVTFQRPLQESATFTILNHAFQITGLR